MKKKIWIPIAVVLLLAVLFVPLPTGNYKDGGTREYTALTYKIVKWNRLTDDVTYDKTKVYLFPNNFKSIDSLWYYEKDDVELSFIATVCEISGSSVTVQPVEGEDELRSSDKISFSTKDLDDIDVQIGSVVQVFYTGTIRETYPASIDVTRWKLSDDLRHLKYTEQWLEKNDVTKYDYEPFSDIIITKIYSDCFFAETVIPMPYKIKLNGTLSSDWCVGDQVICTYENTYYDEKSSRIEADMLTIAQSDFELDSNACYKPVIYLYPENEMDVSVNLTLDGKLTCTYPAYKNGWRVTAFPDGTLTDTNGKTYNYLYWEGETYAKWDMSKGFCVKGEDTSAFLETALSKLGLTRREANEFIVYWLPLMEQNLYNIISFQTDVYTDAAHLEISPSPDTVIRIFMAWQKADSYVDLPKQNLTAPDRQGFTVVEWGGTELK